jgi:uncharacterized protein with HEPN domain
MIDDRGYLSDVLESIERIEQYTVDGRHTFMTSPYSNTTRYDSWRA